MNDLLTPRCCSLSTAVYVVLEKLASVFIQSVYHIIYRDVVFLPDTMLSRDHQNFFAAM